MSNGVLKNLVLRLGAAALAVAITAYPAQGQLLQPMPGVSTLSAAGTSDLPEGSVRDVIYGNNSRGPYVLSWKGLPVSRETVTIDGRRASRLSDYSLDHGKGQISFTRPLGARSLAVVQYELDPETSKRNSMDLNIPIALDLYASDSTNLQFTTLYNQDQNSRQPGEAVFGLSGKSALSDRTEVTTSLYLTPSRTAAGADDTSFSDRMAGSLGARTSFGDGWNLSGSYVRAGEGFGSAKTFGMKTGNEAQDIALSWARPEARIGLTSAFNKVSTGGASTTTWKHNLSYALSPRTSLGISRLVVEKDASGSSSAKTTDVFQLDHRLNDRTSAKFVWTGLETDNGSGSHSQQIQHLSLNSKLLTHTDVTASLVRQTTDDGSDASSVDVGVKSRPLSIVELQASFSGNDTPTMADSSGGVRIAAVPSDRFRLSAGISDRQRNEMGIRSQDLRVDAQPFSFLSLSSGYGYSDSGADVTRIRDISAKAHPWEFLTLDGLYRERELGDADLNTATLSVQVDPLSFLGITAGFQENPEDRKGNVQQFDTRSLGLTAQLGIVSLTGAYAFKDEYLIGREWFQTQLGMGIRLAASTDLTGGYEYSETEDVTGMATRRVSLGLRRNLGSDFNLMVQGSRMDRFDLSALDPETQYEAELRLGVRF